MTPLINFIVATAAAAARAALTIEEEIESSTNPPYPISSKDNRDLQDHTGCNTSKHHLFLVFAFCFRNECQCAIDNTQAHLAFTLQNFMERWCRQKWVDMKWMKKRKSENGRKRRNGRKWN